MVKGINNNAAKVIEQLESMNDIETMKKSVRLSRTGAFQSRTVTVVSGGADGKVYTCTVQELISKLGKEIKDPEGKKDVKKLKKMLTAVSAAEKEDRFFLTSSLYHLFSNRDIKVKMLQEKVGIKIENRKALKIENRKALELLKNGIEIDRFPSSVKNKKLGQNLLEIQRSVSKPVNPDEPQGPRKAQIFIQFDGPSTKYGKWADREFNNGEKNVEAQIYIRKEDISNDIGEAGTRYTLSLANVVRNGDVELSTQDLKNYILGHKNM
jgi:hypothetical protein